MNSSHEVKMLLLNKEVMKDKISYKSGDYDAVADAS